MKKIKKISKDTRERIYNAVDDLTNDSIDLQFSMEKINDKNLINKCRNKIEYDYKCLLKVVMNAENEMGI